MGVVGAGHFVAARCILASEIVHEIFVDALATGVIHTVAVVIEAPVGRLSEAIATFAVRVAVSRARPTVFVAAEAKAEGDGGTREPAHGVRQSESRGSVRRWRDYGRCY